ncbi:uncharacterized protein LAESUDRAFT_20029 [Laetiporus sulphureus 93-53]|uniref:MARVEL domain-containing protein n=1 Tax=Laetiporus sulphureus 93-53 TaxID=1314785 RepID=A0A165ICI6_9APHY|nr:uncharacterized protein LAESUDRAFT_20029 [Laetiporus sulphureus 93-53]KZT12890.1 hypothetical protein LAESUDRAFT_20029 [Laetiporus sulphureus 93-53]
MFWLSVVRFFVFIFTIICAICALGLSARIVDVSNKRLGGYPNFAALGIATACLTLLTLPVMLILDMAAFGFFTSTISFEIVWLTILWILWVATAGSASHHKNSFFGTCRFWSGSAYAVCRETQAVEGFAYAIWIVLFCYTLILIGVAFWRSRHGRGGWSSSVKETSDDQPATVNQYPMTSQPGMTRPLSHV